MSAFQWPAEASTEVTGTHQTKTDAYGRFTSTNSCEVTRAEYGSFIGHGKGKWALGLIALALVLNGCGSDKEPSPPKTDEEQIRAVLNDFAAAVRDRNFNTACTLMTSEAKAELVKTSAVVGTSGGECGGTLKAAVGFLGERLERDLENYSVGSISINGDRAMAIDSARDSSPRLRKEGGRWLLEDQPGA
jgi:hypothetical protein